MRVTFYDKNPGKGFMQWLLKTSWLVGCWLQKLFGAVDEYHGVESIDEMREWMKSKNTTFSSIQYWGHGSPGTVWVSSKPYFDYQWLWLAGFVNPDSIVWFRICSLFQGRLGERFSRTLADHLGCTIAGHTRIIGIWQGGLHTRKANSDASWSLTEGTEESKLRDDLKFWNKNTILFLRTSVPKGW